MIDMEAGARLSGARFAYLKGDLVLLELALVRWALERRARARLRAGDPAGARARAGALRHRLPARHRAADLPAGRRRPLPHRDLRGRARLAARRRDPRGGRAAAPLRRLLALLPPRGGGGRAATPAGSSACTSSTRSRCSRSRRRRRARPSTSGSSPIEESLLARARMPYRVVNIAVSDLGASAAKKYDCEAWLPSQERYRELTSCSNTTDFQARRLEIRVRPAGGGRPVTRTPSTGRRWRLGARSSPCSRTTSARIARWRCRPVWWPLALRP